MPAAPQQELRAAGAATRAGVAAAAAAGEQIVRRKVSFSVILERIPTTTPSLFFALVIDRLFGAVIGWTAWSELDSLESLGLERCFLFVCF